MLQRRGNATAVMGKEEECSVKAVRRLGDTSACCRTKRLDYLFFPTSSDHSSRSRAVGVFETPTHFFTFVCGGDAQRTTVCRGGHPDELAVAAALADRVGPLAVAVGRVRVAGRRGGGPLRGLSLPP